MTRAIRTYTPADRAAGPDFWIRDETSITRIAEAHRHDYFQVQLNLAGKTEHHIAAAVRPLGPGGLSFVLPYRVHRVPHPPRSKFYVLSFNLRFLRPELGVDPLDLEDVPLSQAPELAPFLFQEYMDFRLSGRNLALAHDACRRMAAENARRGYGSAELIRGCLLLLLGTVCRSHERGIARLAAAKAQRASRRDALARVMRHVRENLGRRLQLADAAAAADLSPNYLAHLIKKETGRTFVDLVTERRMEKARELLAHTDLRIGEVARATGFEDEAYFARRFRQRYALSPRQFRTRYEMSGKS
ncbi:MAG: AraC family transcriptional regulator [Burkholderiales bacterium]|nr:AraC family transcriptional regulator [Burkholderiales bacterium]